jgi:hypothetical protein
MLKKSVAIRAFTVIMLVVIGASMAVYGASLNADGKTERDEAINANRATLNIPSTVSRLR